MFSALKWQAPALIFLMTGNLWVSHTYAETGISEDTCSSEKLAEIRQPASKENPFVTIDCSFKLTPKDVITKELRFIGNAATNTHLDCRGATITTETLPRRVANPIIHIRSEKIKDDKIIRWEAPQNIKIINCKIIGSIRITGMARTGEGKFLRTSSRKQGHTQRAQNAAPSNVTLDKISLIGTGTIPLYIAPGATHISLTNSQIKGRSVSVGIYMDTESGHNIIKNNKIAVKSGREQIAVDGSAHNLIANNRFAQLNDGGIYIYRNCGEGGTIRHQKPQHNHIEDNHFFYKKFPGFKLSFKTFAPNKSFRVPAIWLGSRRGYRPFCSKDNGFPFGSSVDNRNFARHNKVTGNRFVKRNPDWMIINSDKKNIIRDNRKVKS